MPTLVPPHANKKRHTKPCIYYQTGQCPFAPEDCDFAHVHDEQATLGPDALRSKYRTKPCRYYLAGSCTQEIWCRFKHPIGDFPRPTMSDLGDEEEDFSDVPDVRDVQPHMKRPRELHPKYKTRPCRDWLLGSCQRGATCSYLHEQAASPIGPPPPDPAPQYAPQAYSQWLVYPSQRAYGRASDDEGAVPASDVSLSPPSDRSSFNDHGPPTPPDQLAYMPRTKEVYPGGVPYVVGPGVPYYGPAHSPVAFVPISPTQAFGYGLWSPTSPQYSAPLATTPRARSQPPGGRRRSATNRSKPCKAFQTRDGCPKGDKCGFAHVPLPVASVDPSWTVPRTLPPAPSHMDLPDKPKNTFEDLRAKDYYPITWRVVGGGVKLAKPEHPEPVQAPPIVHVEPAAPSMTPTRMAHARTSPRTQKTMSISIPASARLVPIELESDTHGDILQVRSTPSSPHRGYSGLPQAIYSANYY